MIERENYADVGTIEPEDVGDGEAIILPGVPYPPPLAREARRGVFGDLVALLEPHTEADPIALLIQAMVAFGSIVGRHAYFVADGMLALRAAGAVGLTRSEMSRDVFGRNRSAREIAQALALLREYGLTTRRL